MVRADVALVRHGRERRQQATAADHDAVGAPLDEVHGLRRRIGPGPVGLRIDQRVGHLQVVVAAVVDDPLRAFGRRGLADHPHADDRVDQEARHEIGQPAHQPVGPQGAQVVAAGELAHVLGRAGLEIGLAHRLAGPGGGEGQDIAIGGIVLVVIEGGERADDPLERRIAGDVGHQRAVDVQRPAVAQGVDVFLPGLDRHSALPSLPLATPPSRLSPSSPRQG